jgi:hypothetical protein
LFLPGTAMLFTVIVTGNHYWLDGAIGTLFAAVPAAAAIVYSRREVVPAGETLPFLQGSPGLGPRLVRAALVSDKQALSTVTLGVLLAYLIVRQVAEPGFTDYWGYMLAQIAATMVVSIWLENRFLAQGGLSWLTHLIVVSVTWADTLGTAGHLYEHFVAYDKITHLLGVAAITAASADVFGCMARRGTLSWSLSTRLLVAVGIGVLLGVAWEVYEYLGDDVFQTGRHKGAADTIYDLISDTAGALVVATLLWWRSNSADERRAGVDAPLREAVGVD